MVRSFAAWPRRGRGVAVALACGAIASACQWVGGIDHKHVDEQPVTPDMCVMPEVQGPYLRGVNLVPESPAVTFCARPSTGGATIAVPGGAAPCPRALAYGQLSAPVPSPGGDMEAWVVSTGRCEDIPSGGLTHMVGGEPGMTLAWLGGGDLAPSLRVYPDSAKPSGSSARVRVLHAAPGLGPIDVGTTNGAGLPSTLTSVLLGTLAFGDVPQSGPGVTAQVDQAGYAEVAPVDFFLGGASHQTTEAVFATRLAGADIKSRRLTLFVTGSPTIPSSPVRPWLCAEDELQHGLAACETGPASTLRVETFNANLFGLPSTHDELRRPALESTIGSTGADVICLQGVWPETKVVGFLSSVEDRYPHQVHFAYDNASPFNDPRALDGSTPVLPTAPPCGDDQMPAMNAAIDCLRDACSTLPGDDAGQVRDEACGSSSCAAPLLQLVGVDQDSRCASCLLVEIASHTFAEIRQICATEPTPFAMDGGSGTALLSKIPIDESDDWVAPSTWFRRSVARARIRLENGVPLDVYCAYSSGVTQSFGIYNGVYGLGEAGSAAWSNEQRLFVANLSSYVGARSRGGRALIAGAIGVSPEVVDADIYGFDPSVYDALAARFPEATPPDFEPFCTQCADNPYVGGHVSYWFAHVLQAGWAPSSFVSRSPTRMDAVLTMPGRAGPGPLSSEYGVLVTVDVRP